MRHIHLSCLHKWIKSKIVIESSASEACTSYKIKQLECELCKAILPDFIKYKDKMYEIFEFAKPGFKSSMTLETINPDKSPDKTIFIVNLESKNSIRIV